MPARLAIVCTHPIQYNVPLFRKLQARDNLDIRVFYGWQGGVEGMYDPGFGQRIKWDIPLLDGYDHEFVDNVSNDPGTHHFRGIDLPTLEQRVRSWMPTSILVFGWCFKAHLQIMRRLRGSFPIYFRGDSTLLDERPGIRRVLRRGLLRWVYRHVDVAFYVGTNNHDYFCRHGLLESQLVLAPHAVDNSKFESFDRDEAESIRRQLGIASDDTMLLFAGKLEPKKAPDQLLNAFRSASTPNSHLVFAGSGEMERELRIARVARVHFLGFQNQSQMPGIYGAADLVALPSRGPGESWGLALNEAMAAGRAVLASNRVGAATDLIQSGINGWITVADDQASLDRCLRIALASGRASLTSMGQESQKMIQDWSIDAQASAIGNVACQKKK